MGVDERGRIPGRAHIATLALVGHALLLTFSGLAFATFLAPPSPTWLLTPANQEFAALMFRYGGQTTVVLGAIAGIWHAASRLGWRLGLSLFAAAFTISLVAELAGTSTGFPFGPYSYTQQLGYLIAGRVPFNIPTSWFFMMYASLAICARVLPVGDGNGARWRWAITAALVLTAWDVSMDPAMVGTSHWLWHLAPGGEAEPVRRLFLTGYYYGMPFTNWLGWLLTGVIVARTLLAIVPPSQWAKRIAPARLPLVLYAVNGLFPILICVGRGMWWAVWLGTLAMSVPMILALRAGPKPAARMAANGNAELLASD